MLQRKTVLLLFTLIFTLSIVPLTGAYSEAYSEPDLLTKTSTVKQAPEISVQDVDSGLIYSLSDFLGKSIRYVVSTLPIISSFFERCLLYLLS